MDFQRDILRRGLRALEPVQLDAAMAARRWLQQGWTVAPGQSIGYWELSGTAPVFRKWFMFGMPSSAFGDGRLG